MANNDHISLDLFQCISLTLRSLYYSVPSTFSKSRREYYEVVLEYTDTKIIKRKINIQ